MPNFTIGMVCADETQPLPDHDLCPPFTRCDKLFTMTNFTCECGHYFGGESCDEPSTKTKLTSALLVASIISHSVVVYMGFLPLLVGRAHMRLNSGLAALVCIVSSSVVCLVWTVPNFFFSIGVIEAIEVRNMANLRYSMLPLEGALHMAGLFFVSLNLIRVTSSNIVMQGKDASRKAMNRLRNGVIVGGISYFFVLALGAFSGRILLVTLVTQVATIAIIVVSGVAHQRVRLLPLGKVPGVLRNIFIFKTVNFVCVIPVVIGQLNGLDELFLLGFYAVIFLDALIYISMLRWLGEMHMKRARKGRISATRDDKSTSSTDSSAGPSALSASGRSAKKDSSFASSAKKDSSFASSSQDSADATQSEG